MLQKGTELLVPLVELIYQFVTEILLPYWNFQPPERQIALVLLGLFVIYLTARFFWYITFRKQVYNVILNYYIAKSNRKTKLGAKLSAEEVAEVRRFSACQPVWVVMFEFWHKSFRWLMLEPRGQEIVIEYMKEKYGVDMEYR
jgi:hypothetical protein